MKPQAVKLNDMLYVPVVIGAMALMFARLLLAARVLDVEMFGQYSIGLLIANSFCMMGCFGLYPLLQRDLPMFLVKGKDARAIASLNQAMLLAIAGVILGLSISGLGIFGASRALFIGSLLNGLAQQLFLIVTLDSRSRLKTLRYGYENLLRAVIVVPSVVLVGWFSNSALLVLLGEAVLTLLVVAGIYAKMMRAQRRGATRMLVLAVATLPSVRWFAAGTLLAVSVTSFSMFNGDRWIGAAVLNHRDFAIYAFAAMILTLSQAAQSVINVSVFPTLARTYASRGLMEARSQAVSYSGAFLISLSVLAVPGYWGLNYSVDTWYPEFVEAKPLLLWFVVIGILRTSDFWSSFLIVAGRERRLLVLNGLALVTALLVWVPVFWLGDRAAGVIEIAGLALLVTAINYVFIAGASLATIFSRQ